MTCDEHLSQIYPDSDVCLLVTIVQLASRWCDVDHRFDLCRPVPYAGRWRRWDVEQSSFTVVDIDLCISVSVGADHPCCRKPHGSLRSFSLTGTIFSSIPSRIQSSRSQYFTSTNHFSCGFYLNFYWRLVSKSLRAPQTSANWFHGSCHAIRPNY